MLVRTNNPQLIHDALTVVNGMFEGNITHRKLEYVKTQKDGRQVWAVLLGVRDSRKPGSRRAFRTGRRIAVACWHVWGHYLDALGHNCEVSIAGPNDKRWTVAAAHGWHDTMIGSPYYGYSYASELCNCGE